MSAKRSNNTKEYVKRTDVRNILFSFLALLACIGLTWMYIISIHDSCQLKLGLAENETNFITGSYKCTNVQGLTLVIPSMFFGICCLISILSMIKYIIICCGGEFQ